jgi:hypothetical protein
MRKPTNPTRSTRPRTASNGTAVPLAVWPVDLSNPAADPYAATWLPELIAEYAPSTGTYLLLSPDTTDVAAALAVGPKRDNVTDIDTDAAATRVAVHLAIGLLHGSPTTHEAIGRCINLAGQSLAAGGLLVIVTRPGPATGVGAFDAVTGCVDTAAAKGFGYLQHLILADLTAPEADQVADPVEKGGRRGVHRTAHLDVTVFRRPTDSKRMSNSGMNGDPR